MPGKVEIVTAIAQIYAGEACAAILLKFVPRGMMVFPDALLESERKCCETNDESRQCSSPPLFSGFFQPPLFSGSIRTPLFSE